MLYITKVRYLKILNTHIKYKNKYAQSCEDGLSGKMHVTQAWLPKFGSSGHLKCLLWQCSPESPMLEMERETREVDTQIISNVVWHN